MYLAKPNHNNFLHSEKFPSIKDAVEYLNGRLMVEEKIDENGNDVSPAMVFPKMKFIDFAWLGKIMRVDSYDESRLYNLSQHSEEDLKLIESVDAQKVLHVGMSKPKKS